MTIEEKAKAYDEALEKAKKKYNSKYHPSEGPSGVYLNNADLEEIFPELKESEDERIRKNLIELLLDTPAQDIISHHLELSKVLAYLEKQKKPSSYSTLEITGVVRKALQECEGYKNCRCDVYAARVGAVVEDLLQEQKPAEWNEEYREENLRTRFAFYTYKNEEDDGILYLSNVFVEETSRNKGFGTKILAAAEKVAETIGAITIRLKVKQNSPANAWYRKHGYGYLAFEDGYDWLEKNLEYLKPKQGWNEDDEPCFDWKEDELSEHEMHIASHFYELGKNSLK